MNNAVCAICSSPASFLGKKNSFDIYRCNGCDTYFPWPIPNEEQTLEIYGQDYFSGATEGSGYVDYDRDKQPMVPAFQQYLDRIEHYQPARGTLLDIGAATGFFLKLAKARNWSVLGVEPSAHASGLGRRDGLDIRTGIFVTGLYPPASLDVITLWDVIEHVPQPKMLIDAALEALKPGGLLALNTPDSKSVLARMLKAKWHLVVPPEHLFLMNSVSLKKLLEPNFEILETDRIGKRFTLQYVMETLYHWQKLSIWNSLHKMVQGKAAGRIELPINLRDNIFILARKRLS
jgi:2-polyprenyl-3-methyl-5-hydroxy-6-metoxy-1,4-benzoquinol methylase